MASLESGNGYKRLFAAAAIVAFVLAIIATPLFAGTAYADSSTPTAANSCTYGYLNQNDWISINALIVLAIMVIGGIIYAVGGIMPGSTKQKFIGIAKYEFVEGIVGLLIIVILVALSSGICSFASSMSQSLVGTSYNQFQFSQYYVGTLLFSRGTAIITKIFALSVEFYVIGATIVAISNGVIDELAVSLPESTPLSKYVNVTLQPSVSLESLYINYSMLLADIFAGLVLLSFGGLFLIFLILPLIMAISLTVLVPLAIAIRSVGFAGPRLRETANSFLALGIALYFIFPMTILFNAYVMGWLYCTGVNGITVPTCIPTDLRSYLGTYTVSSISAGQLFTENAIQVSGNGLPTVFTLPGNVYGLFSAGLPIGDILAAPGAITSFGNIVAQYLFEGVVLIALDFAITIGFAMGLTKGLNSLASLISGGPFW